ncbi:AAA family ATPase [Nanoarchaeota archaeon]
MIIGVTGPISSGKGKVAELFRDEGFVHHSFSREIRAVARERGIEINRKSLTRLGGELREEKPDGSVLGDLILVKIEKELDKGVSRWVIEGMRRAEDANVFREHEFDNKKTRFVLIGVDAPVKERFERLKKRGRRGEPQTFDEFKKFDDQEMKEGGGQEVGKLMKMVDYLIVNDKGLEELKEKVEEIRKEIL